MSSNLTIRDIAKMAGVSSTAVSFVLNGRPGVSEATRRKVKEIIHTTGFTPNVHTRRLNLGRSFTIHVVVWDFADNLYNQFAQETFQGIFRASKALGYSIVFTFIDEKIDCGQLIDSVHSKECDGVILYQVSDPTLIATLQQEQIPFICVDSHVSKNGSLPLVEVDYYQSAYQATMHLCENGHRSIGFIGPLTPMEYYLNTLSGYTDALKTAGLLCDPAWMVQLPYDEERAEAIIDRLLSGNSHPTAFFCAGDSFAMNAIKAIKRRGFRIPEDISLVGLDDLLISRYVNPPLSSMTFNKLRLGELAVEVLYAIILNKPFDYVNLLPTTIVERSSVKKLDK